MKPAATLCAIAAIALAIAAWHPPLAHADGGASTRNQTATPAPNDSPATIQAYALRLLRILTNHNANNWARYWQARHACDIAAAYDWNGDNPPRARALLALNASLCAQLDALLGVNPAAHPPRGNERGAGLMLNEPDAMRGYTLFVVRVTQKIYLIDPLGRVAHTWRIEDILPDRITNHAKLLDSGNLMIMAYSFAPGALVTIAEIDPRGNIVWRYDSPGLHHDFLKMPNGNVLLLVDERKTREQAIAAGANPEFVSEIGLLHDYLIEVRPTGKTGGEIVWQWSVWDHLVQDFDPAKPNYGAIAEHPELIDLNFLLEPLNKSHFAGDWTHINAIDYNPDLDQIMLSPRHFSELWIIDHSVTTQEARGHSGGNSGMGGDLLYRWGNPRAYRHGDADDQRIFWQHQTHWIPPGLPGAGNILLFSNGHELPRPPAALLIHRRNRPPREWLPLPPRREFPLPPRQARLDIRRRTSHRLQRAHSLRRSAPPQRQHANCPRARRNHIPSNPRPQNRLEIHSPHALLHLAAARRWIARPPNARRRPRGHHPKHHLPRLLVPARPPWPANPRPRPRRIPRRHPQPA